jgi:hypothetical protein
MNAVDQSQAIHPLREKRESTGGDNLLVKQTATAKSFLKIPMPREAYFMACVKSFLSNK